MSVITEQCLHRAKAFSASHTTTPAIILKLHKEMGGDINWENWAQLTKRIFHNICHQVKHINKSWVKKVGGHLEWWHLSFQIGTTCDGVLLSWGYWTPACPWKAVNEFLVLLCLLWAAFVFPIKQSLLQPKFYDFLSSLPMPRGCPELSCQLELNHMCLWHKISDKTWFCSHDWHFDLAISCPNSEHVGWSIVLVLITPGPWVWSLYELFT